jgi:adenosine deaminase
LSSTDFIQALESGDTGRLRQIPKADFHNHASLGFSLETLRKRTGAEIPDPPYLMPTWADFIDYLRIYLKDLLYTRIGFVAAVNDALETAQADGVTELEFSIDCQAIPEFGNAGTMVAELTEVFSRFPDIQIRPEVGINREWDEAMIDELVVPMLEYDVFVGIDLYGNEMLGEPEKFVRYYDFARSRGMRLKAHAGEYRDAEFVRRSVEVLGLHEVQHGISAVQSADVMKWLADHQVRLNVCPTSNVRLARVQHISGHPIRRLVDAGVFVTINSDDILVFNKTVSDEYLALYQSGVLSASDLDEIRRRTFRNSMT